MPSFLEISNLHDLKVIFKNVDKKQEKLFRMIILLIMLKVIMPNRMVYLM